MNGLSLMKLQLLTESTGCGNLFTCVFGCKNKDKSSDLRYIDESRFMYDEVKNHMPSDLIRFEEEDATIPSSYW